MLSPVAADQLFNCARQRQRLAKWRTLTHFHDHARDPARGRFFAQFTEKPGQFFFIVFVYDRGGGEASSLIHAHVERTVPNETKTALRIFELTGRNTQIKKRATNAANPEFVENTIRVPEICLPHDNAPAQMRRTPGHMPDCIRILIQSQNIGATFQKRFSVSAAATGSVDDEQACLWLE